MNLADKFDEEFKINAVNLARSSNKPIREIAFELGVGHSTLSRWVRNSRLGRAGKLSTTKQLNPQEEELKKALKELAIVREERDILKKALGIFSLPARR